MPTTDTAVNQVIINRLTKTQFAGASTLSNTELYAVDPQFVGGKLLKTDSNGDIVESTATEADILPSQTGQSGKYLTTNGTSASWGTVDALPSQSGQSGKYLTTNGTTASWANTPTEIPSQSGQSGKFLTTNGSSVSWASVDVLPSQTGNSGKFLTTNGTTASWGTATKVTIKRFT